MTEHHGYVLVGTQRACGNFFESWCEDHGIALKGNPDIFRVLGETATVDTAREVVAEAHKSPFQSEFRLIVWELGYMSEEVSNTLLKVLEDLPERTRMFICLPPGANILPTVMSRVHIELLPLANEDMNTVKKFLNMKIPDRLTYLEKEFFKSEESNPRFRMMELLAGVSELIREEESALMPEIVKLVGYLSQGSATPKYILEYVSHLLPEK